MSGYVYILASERNGTLYTGVTNNFARRINEHQAGEVKGFTAKYRVKKRLYCEYFYNISDAIIREKQIKEWKRAWKIDLIEKENPDWDDLSSQFVG